ncbi:MAG: magnesium transporter CorA family protein [Burkholderiaceae bacterium]|nr:magnesium transporter CorA family protein [Burkholderiaceae bacterium]
MQIVIFTQGSLQFVDQLPSSAPADGFVWVFVDREQFNAELPALQTLAQQVGGSALLDLHCQDLASRTHPSHYDYTSVYDLVIFRRLITATEAADAKLDDEIAIADAELLSISTAPAPALLRRRRPGPPVLKRISTRAVGFVQFDKLLISVHPRGCYTARWFVERYLADAVQSENVSAASSAARSRLPSSPADLMLRMINMMVDSYLELRKDLSAQLDHWQAELLNPRARFTNWNALMAARTELHTLEDLCEEQHDAMQEWLDTLREQANGTIAATSQAEHDGLVARARDVVEHIERVVHHVRRLEQTAESAIQIHFGAQSNRTNDIMRTLTALTAIFLPLNLITGFFGMNFETFPLIHYQNALWWTIVMMLLIAIVLGLVFWRKRYLARTGR